MDKTVRNISRRFEFQWIFRFTLVTLLGGALLLFLLKRFFAVSLSQDFKTAFFILKNLEGILLPIIGISVFFYAVVVSIAATVIMLYLSHAIAAPLFRVEVVAEHIRKGDLTCPVAHLPGDQLEDLTVITDSIRLKYANQLLSLRPHIDAIDEAWVNIDSAPPDSQEEITKKMLLNIEDRLKLIEQGLGE